MLRSVVAVILLVLLQVVLLDGFWNHLDLHPCDGVVYLQNGLAIAAGEWHSGIFAWAPVVSCLHALLHVLGVATQHAQDVVTVIVAVGSTLALRFLLRPIVGELPATAVAVLWAVSPLALQDTMGMAPAQTYLMCATLCWLGLGFAARERWLPAAFLLGVAMLERGELSLPLILGSATAAFVLPRARRTGPLILLGLALVALVFHQAHAPNRAHTWLAFEQHYAGSLTVRGGGAPDADFARPEATMRQYFGDADSLLAAFVANPGAIARHVLQNALDLPRAAAAVVLQPFAYAPVWRWATLGALALVAAWVAARRRRALRRLARARGTELLVLAAFAVGALPVALLLLPRAELLTPIVPLAGTCVGVLLRAAPRRPLSPAAGLTLLAALVVLMPRPFASGVTGLREFRAVVHLIQRHAFQPGDKLCCGYANHLLCFRPRSEPMRGVNLHGLRRATVDECAAEFARAAPTLVLMTPSTVAEWGPLGLFLVDELSTDRWEVDDFFFPVLLYRRVP